jgi:four helix bundle protein
MTDIVAKEKIKSYRDLLVWRRAMDLVVLCYHVAALLPGSEIYGLRSQLQRAAVSIPANIAEGHGRDHLGDYLHHLSMANGSLMELETHLQISVRLSYLKPQQIEASTRAASELGRMLAGLIRKLQERQRNRTPRTTH